MNDVEVNIEIAHINYIYTNSGFKGVMEHAKHELRDYGTVKEIEPGLWKIATGGWTDHEWWVSCLNHLSSFINLRGHYVAWRRGGAHYYTEKPRAEIKITLAKKGD